MSEIGTTEVTCWADPLTRRERRELARMLARACGRFYVMPASNAGAMHSQIVASAEMSDLHMDVTERAAVLPAPVRCRHHGEVPAGHFPCRAPGETPGQVHGQGFRRDEGRVMDAPPLFEVITVHCFRCRHAERGATPREAHDLMEGHYQREHAGFIARLAGDMRP